MIRMYLMFMVFPVRVVVALHNIQKQCPVRCSITHIPNDDRAVFWSVSSCCSLFREKNAGGDLGSGPHSISNPPATPTWGQCLLPKIAGRIRFNRAITLATEPCVAPILHSTPPPQLAHGSPKRLPATPTTPVSIPWWRFCFPARPVCLRSPRTLRPGA